MLLARLSGVHLEHSFWQPEEFPADRLSREERLARFYDGEVLVRDVASVHRLRWRRVYALGHDFNFVREQEIHRHIEPRPGPGDAGSRSRGGSGRRGKAARGPAGRPAAPAAAGPARALRAAGREEEGAATEREGRRLFNQAIAQEDERDQGDERDGFEGLCWTFRLEEDAGR